MGCSRASGSTRGRQLQGREPRLQAQHARQRAHLANRQKRRRKTGLLMRRALRTLCAQERGLTRMAAWMQAALERPSGERRAGRAFHAAHAKQSATTHGRGRRGRGCCCEFLGNDGAGWHSSVLSMPAARLRPRGDAPPRSPPPAAQSAPRSARAPDPMLQLALLPPLNTSNPAGCAAHPPAARQTMPDEAVLLEHGRKFTVPMND